MADGVVKQSFVVEYDGKKLEVFTNDLKKVQKQSEDTGKAAKDTSDKWDVALGKMAAKIVTVAAAWKAAKIGVELGELGAQVMTVDKNFQQFAKRGGGDAIYMMDKLRKASGGMMNDMVLQQNAMKAMISGIEFDDMIVAMEYVRKYALATGSDVNEKMTTVMTGLARGSAQFMDDVGIQVMGAKDVVGASIEQMKKKMGEFADTSTDASARIEAMKTNFENLKQTIGVGIAPALGEVADYLSDIMMEMGDATELGKGFVSAFKGVAVAAVGIVSVFKAQVNSVQMGIELLKLGVNKTAGEALTMIQKVLILEKRAASFLKLPKGAQDFLAGTIKDVAITALDFRSAALQNEKAARKHAEALIDTYADAGNAISEINAAIAKGSTVPTGVGAPRAIGGGATVSSGGKKSSSGRVDLMGDNIHMKAAMMADEQAGFDLGALFGLSPDSQEETISRLESFMQEYGSIVASGMSTIGDVFNAVYSKQIEDINMVSQAQIDAVNSSSKSEKQKAKEIKKIQEQARKDAHEIRMKEWRSQILMSIASTALAVTQSIANNGGLPLAAPFAIATGVIGAVQTGIIASNKPRYFYGSRDSSGAYTTIGGNSSGDTIPVLAKSNEMLVSGKGNVAKAQAALNGKTQGGNMSISVSPVFNVSGSVDRSTADYLVGQVENIVKRTYENNRYTNLINTAFA